MGDLSDEVKAQVAELIDRKVREKLEGELYALKVEATKAVEWQRGQHEATVQKSMLGKLGEKVSALHAYQFGHYGSNYHGYHNPFLHGHYGHGYHGWPSSYGYLGHLNGEEYTDSWIK